jgi:hypothetical protein
MQQIQDCIWNFKLRPAFQIFVKKNLHPLKQEPACITNFKHAFIWKKKEARSSAFMLANTIWNLQFQIASATFKLPAC